MTWSKRKSMFLSHDPDEIIASSDQNNSYEITINGFQVRKINEIRNVIFGLRYGKPSSALRLKLGCSPS